MGRERRSSWVPFLLLVSSPPCLRHSCTTAAINCSVSLLSLVIFVLERNAERCWNFLPRSESVDSRPLSEIDDRMLRRSVVFGAWCLPHLLWVSERSLRLLSGPALYPAASAQRVSFRQAHRWTGSLLQAQGLSHPLPAKTSQQPTRRAATRLGDNELFVVEDRDLAQAPAASAWPPGALPVDEAAVAAGLPVYVRSGARRQNEPEDGEEQGEEDEQ